MSFAAPRYKLPLISAEPQPQIAAQNLWPITTEVKKWLQLQRIAHKDQLHASLCTLEAFVRFLSRQCDNERPQEEERWGLILQAGNIVERASQRHGTWAVQTEPKTNIMATPRQNLSHSLPLLKLLSRT